MVDLLILDRGEHSDGAVAALPVMEDLAAEGVAVVTTCRLLGFSTQAFNKWRAQPWSDSEWEDAHLINAIVDLHADDPEFGYRFLHDELVAAGHGAITMKNCLAASMTTLPDQLARSLTWDRGKELSAYADFTVETNIPVFFADPKSPWQRDTNENTNGLLRDYFPKGTDLTRWSAEEIEAVAATLNSRPRKILGWRTPAEAFDEHLRSLR